MSKTAKTILIIFFALLFILLCCGAYFLIKYFGNNSKEENIAKSDDITIQTKYRNITTKLHIEDINKLDCNALSWWEKQKVAIARAMINNPEFVIADEPTGNLDREYTQEIGDLLVEANKSWNTILLITHDVHLLNYIKSKTNVNVFQLW